MSEFINIRGYSIPFDQPVLVGNELECIDRRAFDEMLGDDCGSHIPIVWGGHEPTAPILASTADSAGLFADDYGLGFWARLDMRSGGGRESDNWFRLRAMMLRRGPTDQCSVNLVTLDKRIEALSPCKTRRVTKATIDHIAIVGDAAYGQFTGVWPTHVAIEDAPWRIQKMAAQWEVGHAEFHLKAKRQKILAASEAIVKGAGHGVSGDLSDGQLATINSNISQIEALDHSISRLIPGGV